MNVTQPLVLRPVRPHPATLAHAPRPMARSPRPRPWGACTLSCSADARSWSGCCRPLVKYQELFNRKVVHLLNQAVPNPGYLSFGLSEATERASVRQ